MANIRKRASWLLLGTIVIFFLVSLIDLQFYSGELLINGILSYTKENEVPLSIIISALLLVAYLMQYFIQETQAELASRQEKLMEAGFTPIIGITKREWGKNRRDDTDMDTREANKIYLDMVNYGNSTAKNLRLWVGIDYDDGPSDRYFASTPVNLQRTEEGTWWPTDVGGALSNEAESSTEFSASPKLQEVKKSGFLKRREEAEDILIEEALEDLKSEGIEEVTLLLELRYETTTGEEQSVNLALYQAKLAQLEDSDWQLYSAQELGMEKLEDQDFQTA